ncbi:hypothetical protein NEHOM01_0105 [Nematocida homosporus]|uniref:uncharacterized protein n=1 Tax=Nematocida homosporus TaxID=1912981 RepID=UPI0022209FCE|nr:uncharacterized protein NEHOM01_0105 [Nematocida homosporus]KAI5184360.1 hypothetical protein NEHOM01_0105 [Nematocida homosporus]
MLGYIEGDWVGIGVGISQCEYRIKDPDFPYEIEIVKMRYNYNRDMVEIVEIDNATIKQNVAAGYVRVRDRMGYQEYGRLVMQQIEEVFSGKVVNVNVPVKVGLAAVDEGMGLGGLDLVGGVDLLGEVDLLGGGSDRIDLDIEEREIRGSDRFIRFKYRAQNVRAFKLGWVGLSFRCQRCGTGDTKVVGRGKEIEKDTESVQACRNCGIYIKIETTFHLIVVDGDNKHNLMRIDSFCLVDLYVSDLSFNCVCDMCGRVQEIGASRKVKCGCGYVLEIRPDKVGAFADVQPVLGSSRKGGLKSDLQSLFKTNGTCVHYKKSTRIFVFPCCGERYPCDICHNDKEEHLAELAKRMICGICRTEAPVAPTCPNPNCRAKLTGSHSAHWEGGKGSRDKATMSKKDRKKYTK